MPGRRFFKNTKPRKCRPPLLLVAAISLLSRTIQRGRGPSHLSAHVKFFDPTEEEESDNTESRPASHQPADRTTPFSRLNKRREMTDGWQPRGDNEETAHIGDGR